MIYQSRCRELVVHQTDMAAIMDYIFFILAYSLLLQYIKDVGNDVNFSTNKNNLYQKLSLKFFVCASTSACGGV